ncbi:hypothetical protein EDD16DRAFT_1526799 [Pisolithus croceorrhizus]|nr:hypothetical protein EV401DRAFT_1895160 [Pisolithus croceorrhizus]KAI6099400.1 hypothetical protein EDD16DRAFT_1526799 [Pisolithus croceorrhizus]KAI6168260.1 hypothetical protein EDD17DRAFT_1503846 [Pisolithus thermaeus]
MKNPKSPSGNVGSVAWLAEGIGTEDSQQEVKTSEKRQRLLPGLKNSIAMVKHFAKGDPAFCRTDEEEHEDREFWDDDDEGDWEAPQEEVKGLASELMSIWMPSSIGAAKLTELGLHDLLKVERELRIGQVEQGMQCSDAGPSRKMTDTSEVVNKGVGMAMDAGDEAPEESSPAWHASKDHIAFLGSLSIMPRDQALVDLVEGLPEESSYELGLGGTWPMWVKAQA